jgi:hypothetical protein
MRPDNILQKNIMMYNAVELRSMDIEKMNSKKIGLVFNTTQMGKDPSWLLDNSSIETYGASWSNFGYEIIYRINEIRAPISVVAELKRAFMKPFGLHLNQYRFEPTFWRIYWDRGQLRVNLMKECEDGLDKIARRNDIAVILNDVIIQPRPMDYIRVYIEQNEM